MAAVYFLGVKEIKSKKSGKHFYPAKFLTLNAFGEWDIFTKFCESEDVYEDIVDNILVGSPVVCSLDMSGSLLKCVPHDTFPALDLPDPEDVN